MPNSSEQLGLERTRNLQKEVALHHRRNEASLRAALASGPPPKTVLSTTVPKDSHFHMDSRIKAPTSDVLCKETDFVQQLRKPSSPVKAQKGATVPRPFSFSVGHNKEEPEDYMYVPIAQRIEQFQNRIPTLYHRPSHRDQERGLSPVKGTHLKLTQPQSPCLMTRQRSGSTRWPPDELATKHRAKELYKLYIAEKNALRAQLKEQQRQREKEEIARLHQEEVHKAQPIRQYRPVVVKKSERPRTVPESPNFSKCFRL